jgi:FAD/FMN-containing dehydrogenase
MEKTLSDTLRATISGRVVTPDDSEYENARASFIAIGSPAVVVYAENHQDITAAITFANTHALSLSIRSGGHGFSGHSTNIGGVILDLSAFNLIEVIDTKNHIVRVGAGAKWGDVAEQLGGAGLAISSGDTTSVGVGGLTLGGGIGWQVRKYGLTIDQLHAAEVVLANGRVVRASETEESDLFWAVRGGGGNFGVVTSFEFKAHELKQILKAMIMYPVDEAEHVLTKWAEVMRKAPEELNATFIILPGFGPEPVPMMVIWACCAADDEAAARTAMQPLLELGTLQHHEVELVPYYKMLDEAKQQKDMRPVAQTGFVKTIDANFINAVVASYGRPNTPIFQVRSLGGQVDRIASDATAFAHRGYEGVIWSVLPLPADLAPAEALKKSNESWELMKSFVKGAYVNFQTDSSKTSIDTAYPPETLTRLRTIKAVYDPENIFKQGL